MPIKIMTLTYTRSAFGAHMRHEEMVRNLTKEDCEVLWLAPSGIVQIPTVKYLTIKGDKLLGTFPGKLIATIISLYQYRREFRDISVAFCINEIQALALLFSMIFFKIGNQSMKLVFFSRMDPVLTAQFNEKRNGRWLTKLRWSIRKKMFLLLQRWLFLKLDRIVVQAPFLAHALTQNHPAIGNKIKVLPNSTTASWMCKKQQNIRNRISIGDQQNIVAYVGNLHWEGKGLNLILDVAELFKKDNSVTFIVIGKGPAQQRLEKEILDRRLSNVNLLGAVENASAYMGSFDILLATSQFDSCPNVVIECMRAGTVVVATDIPAHKYLLGDGYQGLSPSDGSRMAEIVGIMLQDKTANAEARKEIDKAVKRLSFDWAKEVDRMVTKW